MDSIEHTLFELVGRPASLADALHEMSFDELVEIDVPNNVTRNLYHVEGKYFVPIFDGSYEDLYRYSNDHMIHPDDREVHIGLMDHSTILRRLAESETPGVLSAEFRYRLQDGGWRWVKQVVIGGPEQGLPEGIVHFFVFDIQSRKERELGISRDRSHQTTGVADPLTGLPREKDFFALSREFLESDDCSGWCLATLDIEQFKLFNDWYGREAGDFVLANIGAYLAERWTRDGWIAGYLGQDDFCVLLPHDENEIDCLFEDVSGIIAGYGASMSFRPVIGVSEIEPEVAVLDLLDRSLIALEQAKEDFKHPIRTFRMELYERADNEHRLLDAFQLALANREIFFVLQPQCRISNGRIVGVEALARWRKSDGEIVQPDDFVPVLEKFGFITDLDRYIWEDVCENLARWQERGLRTVPVSLNVSRQDIYSMDVADHFTQLIEKYRLPPEALKVEITESTYSDDSEMVRETVQRLQDRGFLVLMDDFGSGYSSLNMLDSVNVDVIKLDMRFLQTNEANKHKSIHIVESVVNMAKTLGLLVITEGVETAEQAEFLRHLGCRYAQGYYFYRPMSGEEFEDLIGDGNLIEEQGFALKSNDEFRIREFLDRNVYSDVMLNNILGAVALYSWDGENVDITRYNEQFYETTGVEKLDDRLKGIQRFTEARDRERLIKLLEKAMQDEFNGATDIIRFRKPDNSPVDMLIHYYFLGEEGGIRRFYGSVRNMTQLTELRDEMVLMSRVSNLSVIFLRKHTTGWYYTVGIHGLEEDMGLSRSELREELESGRFFERQDETSAEVFKRLAFETDMKDAVSQTPCTLAIDGGRTLELSMTCYRLKGDTSRFSFVVVLRRAGILVGEPTPLL